ncbi:relaxase [Vibrio ichthyoenteri ATCC 700023]|uniref:Relaxase n=1 Tax=Vibrio ichthyoenteri ATCC 700023 TaxID=870968 RepID=F9S7S2_9VIBR|nr:LPD7 domain-containing protein [Vibrio ichthyoenteri]EGU30972.1 relaxase [Vibrio ichthyoenteri ATCC 700023]
MLIRVKGGNDGIQEYLEQGVKNGRELSRDELDERVILDGDLDLANDVIQQMETKAQRYLHITLSFKEDHLDRETLKAITYEFKAFAMKAYHEDEYTFYAEAHLPKVKTYTDRSTGQEIERKPHIHVVIPQTNLVTGKRIEPFGKTDLHKNHIDSFQEVINEKYGLASPKQHVRTELVDGASLVSRHKGDLFPTLNREHKERALEVLLNHDIKSMAEFADKLKESGYRVTTRLERQPNEYLNIRAKGEKKGINLKEPVFLTPFVSMTQAQKHQNLNHDESTYWQEGLSEYQASPKHHQDLAHWNETRCYELRYLHFGNRHKYKAMTPEQQQEFLSQKRNATDEQFRQPELPRPSIESIGRTIEKSRDALHSAERHLRDAQRSRGGIESGGRNFVNRRAARAAITYLKRHARNQSPTLTQRAASNALDQILYDHQQRILPEIKQIQKVIEAKALLTSLERTHGLNANKYAVTTAKDGTPRITCGNRNLNASDFLTKEMHLSWHEAKKYLEDEYLHQQGIDPRRAITDKPEPNLIRAAWRSQLSIERDTRAQYLAEYRIEKQAIKADPTLSKEEQKIALSIAQMNKVIFDMQFKQASRQARDALKQHSHLTKETSLMREELGTVVSHGEAHYQHNKKNEKSYVVTLDNNGMTRELWGKDLARAMKENAIQVGDKIKLTQAGQKDVVVTTKQQQPDGSIKRENIEALRNEWQVTKATDQELKTKAIQDFHKAANALTKEIQSASTDGRKTNQMSDLLTSAEGLGATAHKLGITENPFKQTNTPLEKVFNEGYQSEQTAQALNNDNSYEAWRKEQVNPIKAETTSSPKQKEPEQGTTAFYDKHTEASRILIHYPKLKELGINANSITKTEKVDRIEFNGKQLTASQLLKETHQLKPKEINESLKQIHTAQEKDKQRILDYKNKFMQTQRKTITEMEVEKNNKSAPEKTKATSKGQHQDSVIEPKDKSAKEYKPLPAKDMGDNITHETNKQGHVTYYLGKDKLVTDRGKDVKIENNSDKAVEIGLRLSIEKYGKHLDVRGTQEYKTQLIDVAVKNKLDITFTDKAMNEQFAQRKLEFEKGENIIAKAESKHKENNPSQEQQQQTTQQKQPAKGWDR